MWNTILNPFLTATQEILQAEVGIQPVQGPPRLQRDVYVTADVTVIISLVGDVRGMVLYGMNFETAQALLTRMAGPSFAEFDELGQSGIAELCNIITGRACMELEQLGLMAEVSVPTLIVGRGTRVSTLDIERLSLRLDTEIGPLRLDLALRRVETSPFREHKEGSQHGTNKRARSHVRSSSVPR